MKAIVVTAFGGPEHMMWEDVSTPVIKENEVLIKVVKTSVNFADIKARYSRKGGTLPFIPGLDAAGYVEKVGRGVSDIQVGQRVIAFPKSGSYAEYVVAAESLVFPIPDEINFRTAATSPIVSFLSHRLLCNVAQMERGESVLVHAAAGGVGTTAIQMAKLLGAGTVIGTVGSADKITAAKESGADEVICYEEEDFAKSVQEMTNGVGVDIILDSVSGSVTEKSLQCLARYGRLVHFGNSSGAIGTIKTIDLHASCRSVLGFSLGTTRKCKPHLLKETARHVLPYLASGKLKVHIGHEYRLADAADAHRLMESRLNRGKILLNVE